MRWHDLLFAHWPVEAGVLRPLVPTGLEIETFDGMAWVGVVPFRMSGIRIRHCPPIPSTRAFPEINVRTYVRPAGAVGEDARGVWFFSLDASSRMAVRAARRWYGLPYRHARFRLRRALNIGVGSNAGGGAATATQVRPGLDYECDRTEPRSASARFDATYGPCGPPFRARAGSLDRFLTERYRLFTMRDGRLLAVAIHHVPWPLQPAQADIRTNTMTDAIGITLPAPPPLLHFAHRLDVLAWRPEAIEIVA
ncbi:MAG: YqjF family protein [Longimicrobiales bacterium]